MKKRIALLLACLLLLSACGTGTGTGSTATAAAPAADQVARDILSACGRRAEELECVSAAYEGERLDAYIAGLYGLEAGAWDDCAVYRASGANAFEVSVFHLTGAMSGTEVTEALEAYRHGRQGDFFGYEPEQAAIVESSLVALSQGGNYAAVLICEDAGTARTAFYEALDQAVPALADVTPAPTPSPTAAPAAWDTGRPRRARDFDPPNIDDMSLYDNAALLAAWESGSDQGLDEKEKALLARCRELFDEHITEGMSDYEKERAMYAWLTENVEYDWSHYDPEETTPRDSYEPYGAVMNGKAVCLGYATAFQLFMDLLDVACITVVGASFDSTEDHAWNMVCLDGTWYCVDATWDAGRGTWSYFNVTSVWMAETNHQWDYENVPLATAGDGGQP
ncbi:MAG: transglutaminase domain-containing protein [Oscillospiraceae bacterium]